MFPGGDTKRMNDADVDVRSVEERLGALEERLRRVEGLIGDLAAGIVPAGESEPPDATVDVVPGYLEKMDRRIQLGEEALLEFVSWRADHEEACRWIVAWIESIELDREADARRRSGQIQKFLREIWRADQELRPSRGDRGS
jgi:hypothetical protein